MNELEASQRANVTRSNQVNLEIQPQQNFHEQEKRIIVLSENRLRDLLLGMDGMVAHLQTFLGNIDISYPSGKNNTRCAYPRKEGEGLSSNVDSDVMQSNPEE